MAIVCDASVFAAMAFAEPGSAEAYSLIRSRRLLAPSLLRYEMAQTALRKCRLRPGSTTQLMQAFADSLRVPVRIVEPSWREVVALAKANDLSAYDASYLQLALELRLPLATFDGKLARAAAALGLDA